MDLFKLVGTIAIENSEANSQIEGTTEKAEKSHSKMGIAFQKMGNLALKAGKVVAVGIGTKTIEYSRPLMYNTYGQSILEEGIGIKQGNFSPLLFSFFNTKVI